MPTYRATYALPNGRELREDIQAPGPEVVRATLRARGVFPLDVRELAASARVLQLSLPRKTTAWLLRQLAMQIRTGVPETQAVASLKDSHSSRKVREVLQHVHGALSVARVSFSAALGAFPRILPAHLCAILAAGEGNGPEVMGARLNDVADWLLFLERVRVTVRRSTAYPALLIALGFGYLTFFIVWFVPRFKTLIGSFNMPLPAYSVVVLGAAEWMRSHILLIMAGATVCFVALAWLRRIDRVALAIDRCLLRVPVVSRIYRSIFTTLFAKNYRALFLSGATAEETLELCAAMFQNRAARAELRRIRREMRDSGANLGTALRRTEFLPPEAVSVIATAEENGALPENLKLLAEQYEAEASDAVSSALACLSPILLILLGAFVGAVVLALAIPMAEFFKYV